MVGKFRFASSVLGVITVILFSCYVSAVAGVSHPGGEVIVNIEGSPTDLQTAITDGLIGGAWHEISGGIYYNDGNVGIGTTNPSNFKLQVAGNIGPETDSTSNLGSATKRFNNGYIRTVDSGANSLSLNSGGSTRLFVHYNGNVGIGTTTPNQKLSVIGDIGSSGKIGGAELCIGADCRSAWPTVGSVDWAAITNKPSFAANAVGGRVRAMDLGCAGSYAQSCDVGGNGYMDYADSAPWSGISGRPPINAYGSGVQSAIYYDDNANFYVDANSVSYLNDIRASILYDRDDTNFYVDPNGNSKFAGYLQASHLSDVNDPNYYVDPNGGSRFWGDVRIDSGWLYAPKFADINNPSMRYVDPTDHSQIGSLTAYGEVYAFTGLTANEDIVLRNSGGLWGLKLFVWENSGCNYQGVSLGCEGNPPRCLCIKKTA